MSWPVGSIIVVSGILDHPLCGRLNMHLHSRGASARGLHLRLALSKQRAQGRPGACCTRGLACDLRKQKGTRAYRAAGAFRPSLRNGFTAYFVLSPENGSFASVACASYRTLNASTAAPEPHDFTVRIRRVRLAPFASIASHRTFVTMADAPHLP
jgi:hypothetical protein